MCEFCAQHSEGQAWYLTMKNYGQELVTQKERRDHIINFFQHFEMSVAESLPMLDAIQALPFVPDLVTPYLIARQKRSHFGQVVPIEDYEFIDSARQAE